MSKIARVEADDGAAERGAEKLTKIARATTELGGDAARDSIGRARTSAKEAAEQKWQRVQRSAGESAELGRTVVDLLGEQTRHNLQAVAAFGRAVNWAEAAEAQREFLGRSFERMNQLGERYRAMMQAGMKLIVVPSRH